MAQHSDDGSGRIVVNSLTKRYGSLTAVHDLSFTVEPGSITGFLGPNGAGKSTSLRMILGLNEPTSGSSTINGVPYHQLASPITTVGAVLDTTFHPARSGRNHLRVYAAAGGIDDNRVDAVLEQVGLTKAARRKAGGYSLGMRQRLGLATALLGDPQVLLLDEPANGLDPEGIQWLRRFLRHLAGQGRTILISSHLLQEIEQTVDSVVIIAKGELVRQGTLAELEGSLEQATIVRGPDLSALERELQQAGHPMSQESDGALRILNLPTAQIGELAFKSHTILHELRADKRDLEYMYFQLTEGKGDYSGANETADPAYTGGEL
ncbi:MAG: ATP-binding cassette domain-containing protein [Antricoccus sp.]